jgi:hypothetical protein
MRPRHFAPDIGLAPPTLPKDYAPGPATVTHEFAQPSCVVCAEHLTTTELLEIKGHGCCICSKAWPFGNTGTKFISHAGKVTVKPN